MLIFVPLTAAELTDWAQTGSHRPSDAHAVTASLRAAFGFTPADDEDAEHTVLHIAGLVALLRGGRRLVAVAGASATPAAGSEFGQVHAGVLPWSAVTALFDDDEPDAASALLAGLGPVGLETAWDDPRVADFLAEQELSWHGPGEWTALTQSRLLTPARRVKHGSHSTVAPGHLPRECG
ncbi:MAG: hypothetical protein QM582_15140 [Micropruina sp.]|uniref:DUF6912 family protein n=1 Tax=Micropruina sp. TaxID=2737536 RepID=UPI0039E698AD